MFFQQDAIEGKGMGSDGNFDWAEVEKIMKLWKNEDIDGRKRRETF